MKVGDMIRKRSGRPFRLTGLKPADFAPFRGFLEVSGYTEAGLFGRLMASDLYETHYLLTPVYNEIYLKENTVLDRLIKLFFIFGALSEEDAIDALGPDNYKFLMKTGVLYKDERGIRSVIDIFPCRGRFIATDHRYDTICANNAVYPLGVDSYGLARAITEKPMGEVLDLCTGSGVQAIVAARYAKHVTAVDINPRALEFVRLNALLNGLDNVAAVQGSLYEAVGDKKFDFILANPPFVPTPEEDRLLFRDGSPSGEDVLQKIVEGLPYHLEKDGLCQIYTLMAVTGEDYNKKLSRWLKDGPFHILTLVHLVTDKTWFLKSHINPMRDEDYYRKIVSWMRSLMNEGIEKVSYGTINIRRCGNSTGLHRKKDYRLLASEHSDKLDIQLEMMEKAGDVTFRERIDSGIFNISPDIDNFWQGTAPDGEKKYGVLFKDDAFFERLPLSFEQKALMDIISSGVQKGSDIREKFEKEGFADFYRHMFHLLENLMAQMA